MQETGTVGSKQRKGQKYMNEAKQWKKSEQRVTWVETEQVG